MKKILLTTLFAVGSLSSLGAHGGVPSMTNHVYDLSDEGVLAYRDSLARIEPKRRLARYLAVGAGFVGATYLFSRFFGEKPNNVVKDNDLDPLRHEIVKLKFDRDALKKRVKAVEDPSTPVEKDGWGTWLRTQITEFGSSFNKWLPSFVKGMIFQQIGTVIWRSILPDVGEYLSATTTVRWAIFDGTQLIDSFSMFVNWYQHMMLNPEQGVNKAEFAVLGNHLVKEVEKILGYMAYVDELIPEDKPEVKARSAVSMESVAVDIQQLIPFMNEFLKAEHVDQETLQLMMVTIQKVMFGIICHLENFEVVTKEVGLVVPNEQGVFNLLKSYVMPGWQQLRLRPVPQDRDPSEEIAKQFITGAVKDAF